MQTLGLKQMLYKFGEAWGMSQYERVNKHVIDFYSEATTQAASSLARREVRLRIFLKPWHSDPHMCKL